MTCRPAGLRSPSTPSVRAPHSIAVVSRERDASRPDPRGIGPAPPGRTLRRRAPAAPAADPPAKFGPPADDRSRAVAAGLPRRRTGARTARRRAARASRPPTQACARARPTARAASASARPTRRRAAPARPRRRHRRSQAVPGRSSPTARAAARARPATPRPREATGKPAARDPFCDRVHCDDGRRSHSAAAGRGHHDPQTVSPRPTTAAGEPRASVRTRPTVRIRSTSINCSTRPVTAASRRSSGDSAHASSGPCKRSRRPGTGRSDTGATRTTLCTPSSCATPSNTAGRAAGSPPVVISSRRRSRAPRRKRARWRRTRNAASRRKPYARTLRLVAQCTAIGGEAHAFVAHAPNEVGWVKVPVRSRTHERRAAPDRHGP